MAIDPNIALSIRPTQVQPYDPTNALMKAMTLKSLQQQGQTAELEMARMRRADEDAAAIRGIVGNAGGNLRQAADDLLKGGYFEQAQKINSVLQAEESAKLERATKIGTLLKNSATAVLANPTLDFALNALSEFERTTGLKQDGQRQVLQQIGDNPEAIRRWAAGHALEASQLLPKTSTQDVGGYVSDRAVDPLTGVATETGRTQKTLTPESILTDTRTREEGEKNRQVTVRGQDVSAATARRGQDITVRGQNMTDARGKEANAIANETRKLQGIKLKTELQDSISGEATGLDATKRSMETVQRLLKHPGIEAAVGVGFVPNYHAIPGTDQADFLAELDTFKSQMFLPMVQQLKGMGALSNAEGQKLTDAVGALNTRMSEKRFKESLNRIYSDLDSAAKKAQSGISRKQQMIGNQSGDGWGIREVK